MALIMCPECGRQVSDEAATCPNCGYNLSMRDAEFVPVVKPLSAPKKKITRKRIMDFIIAGFLILVGIPFCILGFGIVLIIIGVISLMVALAKITKYQQGECPYCGELLNIDVPAPQNIKCPKCNNVSRYTGATLESTH